MSSIRNRKNQKIAIILEKTKNQKGLAFVMHGLGGFKEQPHVKIFADAFIESGFTVVRFDTTNTIGESEGNYEDATITNYYDDLEDVIKWAASQEWYQEPFFLTGHSLGGICVAEYAENYPDKVKAVAPISTVVSGKLSMDAHTKEEMDDWKDSGWNIKPSLSKPGVIKKLKWSHMEDRLKHDLLPNVKKLTMPVLLIVGDKDYSTPLEHQQILYDAMEGEKEIHIIKDASHTFKDESHLKEIKAIFLDWIEKHN
jgi:alpha-beta hydrolase superfamily lysophospholipase